MNGKKKLFRQKSVEQTKARTQIRQANKQMVAIQMLAAQAAKNSLSPGQMIETF